MPTQPLSALHVTAVRYRGSRPAQGDERALDAYARSDVYRQAQVPVDISEPALPEQGDRIREHQHIAAAFVDEGFAPRGPPFPGGPGVPGPFPIQGLILGQPQLFADESSGGAAPSAPGAFPGVSPEVGGGGREGFLAGLAGALRHRASRLD